MSQGLRDLMSNRRFAIPLIILLAFCFVGLLLIGVVLIWQPGLSTRGTDVAQATATDAVATTPTLAPTKTSTPTNTPTPRPSPTLVPIGTSDRGASLDATATTAASSEGASADATVEPTATKQQDPTDEPTAEPGDSEGSEEASGDAEDEELAQTGVGWGLVLFSGFGLAGLVIAARRLRLAN